MRVLVACEFSGRVRDAFIARGHDAVSCDILPTELEGPHIEGNIEQVIQFSSSSWDLMIAHPPCTYLCCAGLHYSKKNPNRMAKTEEALDVIRYLMAASIDKIAIENPVGIISTAIRKPDQIINPFNFGVPERKKTCLWLKNLPLLKHTQNVSVKPYKTIIRKTGNKAGQSYNYYWRQGKSAHDRSRTFQCIANAMAEQWG